MNQLSNFIAECEKQASDITGKVVKFNVEIMEPGQIRLSLDELLSISIQAVTDVLSENPNLAVPVNETTLQSHDRTRPLPDCRFICFHIIKNKAAQVLGNISLLQIGKKFNNRDHSSVIHGLRKYEDLYKTDPVFRGWADKSWIQFNLLASEKALLPLKN